MTGSTVDLKGDRLVNVTEACDLQPGGKYVLEATGGRVWIWHGYGREPSLARVWDWVDDGQSRDYQQEDKEDPIWGKSHLWAWADRKGAARLAILPIGRDSP